jgi:hypothetical protein
VTTSDSQGLDLYNALQELLDTDQATYLMTHLLPAEMPDLLDKSVFEASMADIGRRFDEVNRRFDQVNHRFDEVNLRFDQVNKRIDRVLLTVVGGMFVVVAAMISGGFLS